MKMKTFAVMVLLATTSVLVVAIAARIYFSNQLRVGSCVAPKHITSSYPRVIQYIDG